MILHQYKNMNYAVAVANISILQLINHISNHFIVTKYPITDI